MDKTALDCTGSQTTFPEWALAFIGSGDKRSKLAFSGVRRFSAAEIT